MSDSNFCDMGGMPWDEGFGNHVFPFMCPDTGRCCHSMCACYSDSRERQLCPELHYRTDGYSSGMCVKYGVRIGRKQDF